MTQTAGKPFDEREKAYEAKFRLDEELAFKARARRNKLFGLWAAGLMGLDEAAAAGYARRVVEAGLDTGSDDDLVAVVLADFAGHGQDATAADLRDRLQALADEARRQVVDEFIAPPTGGRG